MGTEFNTLTLHSIKEQGLNVMELKSDLAGDSCMHAHKPSCGLKV